MEQEPPVHQRRVALAGVYVCLFIDVLTVSMNDRFALVVLVVLEWIVGAKSISVDGQRLLFVITENLFRFSSVRK